MHDPREKGKPYFEKSFRFLLRLLTARPIASLRLHNVPRRSAAKGKFRRSRNQQELFDV